MALQLNGIAFEEGAVDLGLRGLVLEEGSLDFYLSGMSVTQESRSLALSGLFITLQSPTPYDTPKLIRNVFSLESVMQGAGSLNSSVLRVYAAASSQQGAGSAHLSLLKVLAMGLNASGAGVMADTVRDIKMISAALAGASTLFLHPSLVAISSMNLLGAGSQNCSATTIKLAALLLMLGAGGLSEPSPLRVMIGSFIGLGGGALSVSMYFGLIPTVATSKIEAYTLATSAIEPYTVAESYQTLGEKRR